MKKYHIFLNGAFFDETESNEPDSKAALKEFFRENRVEPEFWDRDEKGNWIAVMWTGRYTIKEQASEEVME